METPRQKKPTAVVVLILLLLGSLALNGVLWSKLRQTPPPKAAPAAGVDSSPGSTGNAPRARGTTAAFEIVANPELQGRLGRIVLDFAEGAAIDNTRTEFYRAGGSDMVRTTYGRIAAELAPGNYDLAVTGRKIADIPVESGKDTRVATGVLRLHGAAQTRFVIYEVASEKFIHVAYGNAEFGLPAGDYEVEVSGAREKVTIAAGKVTDY